MLTGAARAQVFTDLNFEQAVLIPATAQPEAGGTAGNPVEAGPALPGWTVAYDQTPISVIWGTAESLDQIAVQVVGDQYNPQTGAFVPDPGSAIDGRFSVNLYGVNYNYPNSTFPTIASISQTGEIPTYAKSIEFLISGGYGVGMQPTVTFNGNIINVAPLSESNGVFTMVGDVSQYAGTVGQLTFSAIPTEPVVPGYPNGLMEDEYNLDDIGFSTQSVPEPSSWGLSVLAAASFALLMYRWKMA